MIYIDPPVKRKGRYSSHLVYFCDRPGAVHYRHYLQDFAISKLDMFASWEQKKGTHLEHFDLIGLAMIQKAIDAGAIQVTAYQFRKILKKKKEQLAMEASRE